MTYLNPKAGKVREATASGELSDLLDNIPQAAEANVANVGVVYSQAEVNAIVTKVNNILTKLRAAKIIAP